MWDVVTMLWHVLVIILNNGIYVTTGTFKKCGKYPNAYTCPEQFSKNKKLKSMTVSRQNWEMEARDGRKQL